jgi:hypothetical protein
MPAGARTVVAVLGDNDQLHPVLLDALRPAAGSAGQ